MFFSCFVHFAPTPEKNLTFLMAHKGALEYVEKQQAGENHLFALILHL